MRWPAAATRTQREGSDGQLGRRATTSVSRATRSPLSVETCRSTTSAVSIASASPSARTTCSGVVNAVRLRRTTVAVLEVVEVVGHEQEGSTRRYGGGGPSQDRCQLGVDELEVGHEHEIEAGRRGTVRVEVCDSGVHPDTAPIGQLSRLGDHDLGEVDRCHLPTELGEPDCVPALADREVDRTTDREFPALPLDEQVGSGRPDEVGGAVAIVPVAGVHARSVGDAPTAPGDAEEREGGGGRPDPGLCGWDSR